MNDDGNCLFHALSDQMPSAGDHIKIRRDVVANMRANPHVYEAFCPYEFDVYLATMAIDGEYGTHLELQSFADLYHVAVFVYSDETPEFPPTVVGEENSERVLHLAFLRGNHYNSVVPLDALEVLHRPNVAAAPAGVECFVCSNKFEDVDLHIAMAHPEIFN
jgi:hypothetical protein